MMILKLSVGISLIIGSCLLSVACQSKEQKAAGALQQCQALLDKGELQNIGDCYNTAMCANPDNAPEISKAGETAIFAKCLDYKHHKDFENSIICLEGMIALRPDSANVNFQLADSYFEFYLQDYKKTNRQDFDLLIKAKESLKDGLKINPKDGRAYSVNGEIFKETGDFEASLANHKKAVEFEPKIGIFWIKLARAQEKLSKNEEAVSSYKKALEINSNDTDALYFLGLLYEKMEKFSSALECYETIIKQESSDEEIIQKVKELKGRIESDKQVAKEENQNSRRRG